MNTLQEIIKAGYFLPGGLAEFMSMDSNDQTPVRHKRKKKALRKSIRKQKQKQRRRNK